MKKIIPFTLGEQAEIRRLLRQADPAREMTPQDLARIERMTMAALDHRSASKTSLALEVLRGLFTGLWPTAAFGAVAAGILLGTFISTPLPAPTSGNLVAVAAAEPWQQYADDSQGDDQ